MQRVRRLRTCKCLSYVSAVAVALFATLVAYELLPYLGVCELKRSGAAIRYLGEPWAGDYRGDRLPILAPRPDAEVKRIGSRLRWYEVERVSLIGSKASERTISLVASLPRVKGLYLYQAKLSLDCWRKVGKLRNIEVLDLCFSNITNESLRSLAGLTNIRELDVSRTMVGDSGLRVIMQFQSVKILRLEGTRISNEGLAVLRGMRGLEVLDLANNPQIDDRAVQSLMGLVALKRLYLSGTRLTETGIRKLFTLPGLLEVYVNSSNTSPPKAMARLRSQMSNLLDAVE